MQWFYFRRFKYFPEREEEKPVLPFIIQWEISEGNVIDVNVLLLAIVGGGVVTAILGACLAYLVVQGVITLPSSPADLLALTQ